MSSPSFAPNHATGPRTEAGKAASSQNSLKHGLASGTLLLPTEDPAEFAALLESLRAEHAPATPTEELLVADMAKHHWLMDRAMRLQSEAIQNDDANKLALYIRYQTANHRAFHKSLATLVSQRKHPVACDVEFVSKPKKQQKIEFENDFLAMMEGPFTRADRDQFFSKYGMERVPDDSETADLPQHGH